MFAVRNNCAGGRIVSKKLLLPIRRVSGQSAAGGRWQIARAGSAIFRSARDAKTEALQGRDVRTLEWLREQPPGKFNFVFKSRVARIPFVRFLR